MNIGPVETIFLYTCGIIWILGILFGINQEYSQDSISFQQKLTSLKEIYGQESCPEWSGHAEIISTGFEEDGTPVIVCHANSRTIGEITEGQTYSGDYMEVATHIAPQTWMVHYVPFNTDIEEE